MQNYLIAEKAGAVRVVKGRLGGKWLETVGIMRDDVFLVVAKTGEITYTRQENAVERTDELVKFARKHKLKLLQVKYVGSGPFLEIPSAYLAKAGFQPDEPLLAFYDSGVLTLRQSNSGIPDWSYRAAVEYTGCPALS